MSDNDKIVPDTKYDPPPPYVAEPVKPSPMRPAPPPKPATPSKED